jgi:Ethanolamine utilization protein
MNNELTAIPMGSPGGELMAQKELQKRCFMILGAVGAGKTTLMQALEGEEGTARKTQSIDYKGWGIDTPGEYTEMGFHRLSLVAAAAGAHILVVVQDATRPYSRFPPNYLLMFPRKSIGVVTKVDMPEANIGKAAQLLRECGVRGDIYNVSALSGEGIDDLRQRLLIEQNNPQRS